MRVRCEIHSTTSTCQVLYGTRRQEADGSRRSASLQIQMRPMASIDAMRRASRSGTTNGQGQYSVPASH
jgi:hypothetical protein